MVVVMSDRSATVLMPSLHASGQAAGSASGWPLVRISVHQACSSASAATSPLLL